MDTQVVDFLFQFAIILLSTKILGILFRKAGLPQVLGFIVAGVFIGPAIWCDLLGAGAGLFPIKNNRILSAFAEVGVIFVMFTAGLETNLKEIKETGFTSFLVALMGVVLPLALGFLLAMAFLPDASAFSWLFVGVIMTATSVGITVEVLRELGQLKTKVGTVVMSAAIIDDVLGIMILSVALSLSGGKDSASPVLAAINPDGNSFIAILWVLAFLVFAIGAGFGISKLFKYIEKRTPHTRRIPILSIAVCLLYAFTAEKVFGVADITGAFIAGVVLSTNHKSAEYVDRKVTISSYTIFAPIFFASIGIKITFADFGADVIWFAIAFVAVAITAKILGCGGAALLRKHSFKESLKVGVGMIARGEVALIVTEKGIAGGLLEDKYRAIVVVLVLVSSLFAPVLLKLLYKKDVAQPLPSKTELEEGRFE